MIRTLAGSTCTVARAESLYAAGAIIGVEPVHGVSLGHGEKHPLSPPHMVSARQCNRASASNTPRAGPVSGLVELTYELDIK